MSGRRTRPGRTVGAVRPDVDGVVLKKIVATTAGLVLTAGLGTAGAAPAVAHHGGYYGDSSRAVARHIGCTGWYRTASQAEGGGAGEYNADSGTCMLKGRRVSVITFRGPGQQREWNAAARFALPAGHWWANGQGALVTARNGNKPAAAAGARALPGRLVKSGF